MFAYPDDGQYRQQIVAGMVVDWDVPIPMEDGVVLRCDVFRPLGEGGHATLMTHGPYAKWKHFEDLHTVTYRKLHSEHPEVPAGSSNRFQVWETVDPEKWVRDGYAIVRVDSRGAGRSPGLLDVFSARETRDYANCIEWAALQPWSNGRVGLNGISYYAINQWQAAALRPKGLAAMCAWEGASDFYREMAYHGGIFCNGFVDALETHQLHPVQHGRGAKGQRSRLTGDWISGPETLPDEELGANRRSFAADSRRHTLATDDYWTTRTPDLARIDVPVFSAANWGGNGLHLRGNIESFLGVSSQEKWLEIHPLEHWTTFYLDYGLRLQKKFFGHYLKDEPTGWLDEPRVRLTVRRPGERFFMREEEEWPLARTNWTKFHLDGRRGDLSTEEPSGDASTTYAGFSHGATFITPPLAEETEITGPIAAKLWVSSSTEDADLFLIVRVLAPDMKEVTFIGNADPHTPVAQGWLRVSHRKLDPERTRPYRPYHTHAEPQPMVPGKVYEVDVEIWPTCIAVPAGYRLALTIRGKDYEYQGDPISTGIFKPYAGNAIFTHDDPKNRPPAIFGGNVTIHSGPSTPSHVLLPVIPA
ncbi:MAG: CocE/NonD family hydrolase [Alphaproteobacteria bacterium]